MPKLKGKLTGNRAYERYVVDVLIPGVAEPLATVAPAPDGTFSITLKASELKPNSAGKPFYRIRSPEGEVTSTRGVVSPSARSVGEILLGAAAFRGAVVLKGHFVVVGQVVNCAGDPLPGYGVEAYDVDLRHVEDQTLIGDRLGRVTTDADGRYVITYRRPDFADDEHGVADIAVSVLAPGTRRRVYTGPVVFNAGRRVGGGWVSEVDVRLPPEARACTTSEYRRLVHGLYPLLETTGHPQHHKRVAALTADELTFASNELEEERSLLETLRLAHSIRVFGTGAVASKYDPLSEQLYGLLRLGLPSSAAAWVGFGIEDYEAFLEQVWDLCCVALEPLDRAVRTALSTDLDFIAHRAWLLEEAAPGRSVRLALIKTAVSSNGKALGYARIALNSDDDAARLSSIASATAPAFSTSEQRRLRRLPLYSFISDFRAEVLAALINESREALAALSLSELTLLLQNTPAVPAPRSDFILRVHARIRRRFGGRAITGLVSAGFTFGRPELQRAAAVLSDPGFDIKRAVLDDFRGQFTGTASEKQETLAALKSVQRLVRTGIPAENIEMALDAGYDSAGRIAAADASTFLLNSQLPVRAGLRIHARARQLHATATGTRLGYGAIRSFGGAATRRGGFQRINFGDTSLSEAAFAAIFGGGSLCDCPAWLSAIGPGAYLDSLLHFLNSEIPEAAVAYQDRCRDFLDLVINAANTFTVVPHIDIVIERLEDEARQQEGLVPQGIDWTGRQTTWTADRLALAPEFPQFDVYKKFGERRYPWSLLGNPSHFEITELLRLLDLDRGQVLRQLEHLSPEGTAEEAAGSRRWTESVLALTTEAYDRLTTTTSVQAAFGRNISGLRPLDKLLEVLTPALGVGKQPDPGDAFRALYMVLKRDYIGFAPASGVRLRRGSTDVDLADFRSHRCSPVGLSLPDLNAARARRIHTFLLLASVLQWPAAQLDHALGHLAGGGDIGDVALHRFAAVVAVGRRLGVSAERALLLSTPFDAGEAAGPFEDDRDLLPQMNRLFAPNQALMPLPQVLVSVIAARAGVPAGFAAARLGQPSDAAIPLGGNEPMLLELARWGTLASSLEDWSPDQLRGFQQWTEVQAFTSGDPAATLHFLGALDSFVASGSSFAVVERVLGPRRPERQGLGLDWRVAERLVDYWAARTEPGDARDLDGLRARLLDEYPEATAIAASLELVADPSNAAAGTAARTKLYELLGFSQAEMGLAGLVVADWIVEIGRALSRQTRKRGVIELLFEGTMYAGAAEASLAELAKPVLESLEGIKLADPPSDNAGAVGSWRGEDLLLPGTTAPGGFAAQPFVLLRETGQAVLEVVVGPGTGVQSGAAISIQISGTTTVVNAGSTVSLSDVAALRVDEGLTPGPSRLGMSLSTTAELSIRLTLVHPSGARTALDQSRWFLNESSLDDVRSASRRLRDELELVENSGISASGLSALLATGHVLPGLAEDATADWLPGSFGAWAPLRRWGSLLHGLREAEQLSIVELHALAQRGDPLSLRRVVDVLADAWAFPASRIEYVLRSLLRIGPQIAATATLTAPAGVSIQVLLDARERLDRERATGMPSSDLEAWCSANPTPGDADALRSVCIERFGREKVRAVADALRVRKRDSLVQYLIATNAEFSKPRDISETYLMNVEMEPPAETSRVRVAFMAVLRLVRQAIEQKEDFEIRDRSILKYWEQVMKTHPVWAGVRLLMMYPENILYTRERYLKHLGHSEIFAKFENRLLQGRLTSEECREALEQYVEDLHEVGHLESVGIFHERAVQPSMVVSTDRVHMLGRTVSEPRSYYHRTFEAGAYWTPWAKIELDIDSDHVLPVVHNGRIHLFWPLVEKEKQETVNVPDSDERLAINDSFLTMRFAWTEYTSRGWRPKTVSQDRWSTRFAYADYGREIPQPFFSTYNEVRRIFQSSQEPSEITLRPSWNDAGDLVIEAYSRTEAIELVKSEYRFDDNHKELLKVLSRIAPAAEQFVDATKEAAETVRARGLEAARSSVVALMRPELSGGVSPGFRTRPRTGRVTRRSRRELLCAEAHLGPDRALRITSRLDLPRSRQEKSLQSLKQTEVRNNGLAERRRFIGDGLFLHVEGHDRLTLGRTPGEPVLTVCRQEDHPTEQHPVVCRIDRRSFYAMKEGLAPPAAGETLAVHKSGLPIVEYQAAFPRYSFIEVPIEPAVALGLGVPGSTPTTEAQGRAVAIATASEVARIYRDPTPAVEPRWRFVRNYHSFSYELLRRVRASAEALFDPEVQNEPVQATPLAQPVLNFNRYRPQSGAVVDANPEDGISFDFGQPFASYNWELFHHAPLMIANQLTRNGRYAEARQWIKVVFDPDDPASKTEPYRAWKFAPFRDAAKQANAGLLDGLADADAKQPWEQRTVNGLVTRWRKNPYDPHAVASFRIDSYQRATFFQYVENLLEWGDSLFVIPNPDSIDEAADYYAAAADLLGEAPETLGPLDRGDDSQTLEEVLARASSWDHENMVAADVGESPAIPEEFSQVFNLDYFCMPPNPKLAELRARTNDRLFKVHNVLDLEGRPRRLPLFLPPVDPALLAAAGAAGLSVGAILADALAPRPHYRFDYLLDVAEKFASYVQELGGSLLAAMEKRDGAALEELRAQHEVVIQGRTSESRKISVDEASLNLEALERSAATVKVRKEFYEKREFMNSEEKASLALSIRSTIFRTTAGALNFAAGIAGAVPDVQAGTAGIAATPVATVKSGGENVARVLRGIAEGISMVGQLTSDIGNIVATAGGHRRRQDDWDFQVKTAKSELQQFEKQIAGAELRIALAKHELQTQETRTEQSKEVLDLVRGKPTGEELYTWMVNELRTLHRAAFELAVRMARQAERAMQFELATDRRLIGFGQWNGLRDGLLSGQMLRGELNALREFYISNNRRPGAEELTISLASLSPVELAKLKTTGACTFTLDEGLFDARAPGRYLRRIHRVSVEVKGVTGTAAGVHGSLSLLRSQYRKEPTDPGNYPRATVQVDPVDPNSPAVETDDPRFVDMWAPRDTILISTGRGDTGVPGEQTSDARYMPFEGAGAISNWALEIPQEDNAFPIHRVADVELKVWVTSRYGGDALRDAARQVEATKAARDEVSLISVEAQFPAEWQEYRNTGGPLVLDMGPWLPQGTIRRIVVLAESSSAASVNVTISGADWTSSGSQGDLVSLASGGSIQFLELSGEGASNAAESWAIDVDSREIRSLKLLVETTRL